MTAMERLHLFCASRRSVAGRAEMIDVDRHCPDIPSMLLHRRGLAGTPGVFTAGDR